MKELYIAGMMKGRVLQLLGICLCLSLSSCQKDDDISPATKERTVLIYMAGDNSLSSDGENNITSILAGIKDFSGNLVVYFDSRYDPPCLLHIVYENNEPVKKVIETYSEEDSASPEVLSRVVNDTKRLFPADSYGLILWSHGMAWLPENYNFPGAYSLMRRDNPPRTKYFGEDMNSGKGERTYMDIKSLRNALPGGFTFILFDACFMSSIEVFYELKDKCDYLIASPAEILVEGFPYGKMMTFLDGGEEDLRQLCQTYYNHYNSQNLWATVAMVKTAELDGLAQVTREILRGRENEAGGLSMGDVWRYPTIASGLPLVFYDFGEYVRKMADAKQYDTFQAQLNRTVIFKMATTNFYFSVIPSEKYSGLSSYIPLSRWVSMNNYYDTLSWPMAVY